MLEQLGNWDTNLPHSPKFTYNCSWPSTFAIPNDGVDSLMTQVWTAVVIWENSTPKGTYLFSSTCAVQTHVVRASIVLYYCSWRKKKITPNPITAQPMRDSIENGANEKSLYFEISISFNRLFIYNSPSQNYKSGFFLLLLWTCGSPLDCMSWNAILYCSQISPLPNKPITMIYPWYHAIIYAKSLWCILAYELIASVVLYLYDFLE